MYTETEENRFLEVTYANGDKEVLYFKDFNSGAMIQNIVDRAKKMAIKDLLDHDQKGLRVTHLLQACVDEFKENEDLPEHHQPRRLGPDLRQEGRADRLHPHAHHRQAGHRAGPVHRHGRQHRPVPLGRRRAARRELAGRSCGVPAEALRGAGAVGAPRSSTPCAGSIEAPAVAAHDAAGVRRVTARRPPGGHGGDRAPSDGWRWRDVRRRTRPRRPARRRRAGLG